MLEQVVFPLELSAAQRACLHAIAERVGLPHESATVGQGDRQIRLGPASADPVQLSHPAGGSVTDAQLASWLQLHLQITPGADELPSGQERERKKPEGGRKGEKQGSVAPGWQPAAVKQISPEAFVAKMMPLLVRPTPMPCLLCTAPVCSRRTAEMIAGCRGGERRPHL